MSHDNESTTDRLEAHRKLDIQEEIEETEWETACLKGQKQSINMRMKLVQYKWLMKTSIMPDKLDRRSRHPPYSHQMFTRKRPFSSLCMGLRAAVQTISETEMCVLGIYPKKCMVSSTTTKKTLIDFGLLQGKRLTALYWRKVDTPSLHV